MNFFYFSSLNTIILPHDVLGGEPLSEARRAAFALGREGECMWRRDIRICILTSLLFESSNRVFEFFLSVGVWEAVLRYASGLGKSHWAFRLKGLGICFAV